MLLLGRVLRPGQLIGHFWCQSSIQLSACSDNDLPYLRNPFTGTVGMAGTQELLRRAQFITLHLGLACLGQILSQPFTRAAVRPSSDNL